MITLAQESDVDDLVELHHQIFNAETHYAVHLGERFMRRVMAWYCKGPNQFTIVARSDDRLVGYACLNLGAYNEVFWSNGLPAIWAILCKPSVLLSPPILRRLRRLLAPRPADMPTTAGFGYLALIAVAAGAGIPRLGTALLQTALSEAGGRGWKGVLTGTRRDNAAAQRLFEKAGFDRVPEADEDNLVTFRVMLDQGKTGGGEPAA